jgi:peptidoglycan/LPS O-acetylase OafA/YrhL
MERAFYFGTRFGAEAVMVFFVLSGLLVGSSALRARRDGTWSWSKYLIARLTRLLVVLAPALVLTYAWDRLGKATYPSGYSGPVLLGGRPPDDSLRTAVGNLAFLQTIRVPDFGTNVALWSLANEFWYYMLFPLCLVVIWRRTSVILRVGALLIVLATMFFIGGSITAYFLIWLLGVAVSLAPSSARLLASRTWLLIAGVFAAAAVVFFASLARAKLTDESFGFWQFFALNFFLGVAAGLLIYVLIHTRHETAGWSARSYRWVAGQLSRVSYTLYLVHVPLLVFLSAWLVPQQKWNADVPHLLMATMVIAVVFAYALVVAHFTEARTDDVRRVVLRQYERLRRAQRNRRGRRHDVDHVGAADRVIDPVG